MRNRAFLGAVLGFTLLACDSSIRVTPTPTTATTIPPTPTATGTTAPTPTAAGTTTPTATMRPAISCPAGDSARTLVVYGDVGDLWLYDVASDRSRRLTDDGNARSEYAPGFLTGACIAYASTLPASVALLRLSGGTSRATVAEEAGTIVSMDVNPGDGSIAYLQIDFDTDAAFRLKRVDLAGGAPVVLHTFQPSLGRGAGSEDEVSVSWSPDGSAILVANTHEYTPDFPVGGISLFDPSGHPIGERWAGTHPRWASDGRTIYYRGYAGQADQGWLALDVGTMTEKRLAIRPGTNALVVAPDGRHAAYDTSYFGDLPLGATVSGKAPDVYLYDFATRTETLLQRGALGPLWISATDVLVTNAVEPADPSMNSWTSLGSVTKISTTGRHAMVDMTSTLFDPAVLLAR